MTETQMSVYRYALQHMEAEKNEIEERINFVRTQMGIRKSAIVPDEEEEEDESVPVGRSPWVAPVQVQVRKKKVFSAAARKRMRDAQKLRWAAHRAAVMATAKKGRKAA